MTINQRFLLNHVSCRLQQTRNAYHRHEIGPLTRPTRRQPPTTKHPYEATIGLEVHAQIKAATKLFSSAPQTYGSPPNRCVAQFDASLPGVMPVLNRDCVSSAILTCLTLGCNVDINSQFDRKHYFYADMPAGYQITQHRRPIGADGSLQYWVYDQSNGTAYLKRTRIERVQIEQDSGKSMQDDINRVTLVDLNRCGNGLMEIVTYADLSSADEASALVRELIQTLRLIDTCDARMDRAELRVDANVSVALPTSKELGVRTEIKNINSARHVHDAILERHSLLLAQGEVVVNETRAYDYKTGRTSAMRDKEVLQDYRIMPEPNLPRLRLRDSEMGVHENKTELIDVHDSRQRVPHSTNMPNYSIGQMIDTWAIDADEAFDILLAPNRNTYFARCISMGRLGKVGDEDLPSLARRLAWWCNSSWLSQLIDEGDFEDMVPSTTLIGLLYRIEQNLMTEESAQSCIMRMIHKRAPQSMEELNFEELTPITDVQLIDEHCNKIIDENKKALDQYSRGKGKIFGFFVRRANVPLKYRIPRDLLVERLTAVLQQRIGDVQEKAQKE